jgi:hypothetical protein
MAAVIHDKHNLGIARLTVLHPTIAQTDYRKTGRPEQVPLCRLPGRQGVADTAIRLSCKLKQSATFFPKSLRRRSGGKQSAGKVPTKSAPVKAGCPIKDTKKIACFEQNVLIEFTTALFQQGFHPMLKKGPLGTGNGKLFG